MADFQEGSEEIMRVSEKESSGGKTVDWGGGENRQKEKRQ